MKQTAWQFLVGLYCKGIYTNSLCLVALLCIYFLPTCRPASAVRTETLSTAASSSLSIDTSSHTSTTDNPFTSQVSSSSRCSSHSSDQQSPLSPKLQYREIQKGGDIPLSGLRKPAPVTPPHRGKPMMIYKNLPEAAVLCCIIMQYEE